MRRSYSRLLKVEEKKNIRQTILYVVLSIGLIVATLFFGLPVLAKFAGFLIDIRKSNQKVDITDTTPPAPPRFDTLPEAVKTADLEVKGNSEAGSLITLSFNGNNQEVLSDNSGNFTFKVNLQKGENKLQAKAKDTAGNESQESQTAIVVFDDEAPKLDISSPSDGSQFYGSRQRQVTIQGTTEPFAKLTVNDRLVNVEEDGTFLYATTLSDGENKFLVKAVDKAENSTEKNLTINFSQ